MSASDDRQALDALLRVPVQDQRYRAACVEAVSIASRLEAVTLVLDQFLAPFVASGPLDEAENEAFYRLGRLYESQGHERSALDVFRRLGGRAPQYRDTRTRVDRLGSARPIPGERGAILREEAAFRGTTAPRFRTAAPKPTAVHASLDASLVVGGRYRLGKRLCEGRPTFAARDGAGAAVTVRLLGVTLDSDAAEERFRSELLPLRGLAHPHLAPFREVGFEGRAPFLVLEPLEGSDLRQRLTWRLTVPEIGALLRQLCAALAAVHARGLCHGDLRPETLFLTADGELNLLDLGVASALGAAGVPLRQRSDARYLSPEQIAGGAAVSAASDLYALGVLAYELLEGRPPFEHGDPARLLALQLTQPPPPLRAAPELAPLVLQLLEKDPTLRPASALACAGRLGVRPTTPR